MPFLNGADAAATPEKRCFLFFMYIKTAKINLHLSLLLLFYAFLY